MSDDKKKEEERKYTITSGNNDLEIPSEDEPRPKSGGNLIPPNLNIILKGNKELFERINIKIEVIENESPPTTNLQ